MVARVTIPASFRQVFYYNENKVGKDKAECIYAEGFLREARELTLPKKKVVFDRRNSRNERAKTKTMHVSLNFDPSEQLSNEKMKQIAQAYMKKIGFDGQPFLVYRHHDAGHPHLHIVTTLIREDGSRINTHNIGRNQSEQARKEIEKEFNLVQAENKKIGQRQANAATSAKLQYGKVGTKEGISQAVDAILKNYLVSSIPELNAVLRKHGVQAETGAKDSKLQVKGGLIFRLLDKDGKPTGVAIKASSLNGKPTLKKLEAIFEKNKNAKEPFKAVLKAQVDQAIACHPASLQELKQMLSGKNIDTTLREASDGSGRIYGVTFIDENNRTVFNGSELGKAYSAAHLQSALQPTTREERITTDQQSEPQLILPVQNLLETLLQPDQELNYTPANLKKKKRKKKGRQLGL